MNQDVVLALTVPGMFGWFAWLIFNTIRRYKIAKLQAEVQTKLLEKVGSGQELLAYAQTETGRELLQSLKVERIAPHGQIIGALQTGIIILLSAQLFCCCSNWIECHVLAFEFFQGTSKLIVPDNPRTAVTRACRYEPDLNRT